jgi:hypothetical protein
MPDVFLRQIWGGGLSPASPAASEAAQLITKQAYFSPGDHPRSPHIGLLKCRAETVLSEPLTYCPPNSFVAFALPLQTICLSLAGIRR